jgi:hypothetical protein
MITITTDLDRTLFPNGQQEYDDSMSVFKRLVEQYRFGLIYVTGRNIDQAYEGMQSYDPPPPSHLVAEVGTRVYVYEDGRFLLDDGYRNYILEHTRRWDRKEIQNTMEKVDWLRLQEEHNQNEFKVSFYADKPENLIEQEEYLDTLVNDITPDAALTISVDETKNLGLLDVMPVRANKMEGIEYLRRTLNIPEEEIIYCGDSGNDLVPLTAGYRAILVRNATDTVRERLENMAREKRVEDRIYNASGNIHGFNGNYVSGIIEGLCYFNIIPAQDLSR